MGGNEGATMTRLLIATALLAAALLAGAAPRRADDDEKAAALRRVFGRQGRHARRGVRGAAAVCGRRRVGVPGGDPARHPMEGEE